MTRNVTLSANLGFYQRVHEHGCEIENAHQYLPGGTQIEVSEPQTMFFDCRNILAVSFWIKGEEFFFLEDEFERSVYKSLFLV